MEVSSINISYIYLQGDLIHALKILRWLGDKLLYQESLCLRGDHRDEFLKIKHTGFVK